MATADGVIFDLKGYAAVGMAGNHFVPLTCNNTIVMPFGSESMLLPDRQVVAYNLARGCMETLTHDPQRPQQPVFPVAAFNSPGYVVSQISAYRETPAAEYLPLFGYGAVGWHSGHFRTAALLVDDEPRQDLRAMPVAGVQAGVAFMRRKLPHNRLARHLEICALQYGCPAAKNFFLGRYEAPLPTARSCNAQCWGCLSHQHHPAIPVSQNRIAFTPTSEEIAEVALMHIGRVRRAVVSFGQGCEGDPLLAAEVIAPAIRRIRQQTDQGTININTNAGRPAALKGLLAAGLDSLRVSLNSVRKPAYEVYFRPLDYEFEDVLKSIDMTLAAGRHVSINYLNMPGFTDTPKELRALLNFIRDHAIQMIQWRNLNFDPLRYWKLMQVTAGSDAPMGMAPLLKTLRREVASLRHGYFNPPKESFTRS